jgi:hypothetical protein
VSTVCDHTVGRPLIMIACTRSQVCVVQVISRRDGDDLVWRLRRASLLAHSASLLVGGFWDWSGLLEQVVLRHGLFDLMRAGLNKGFGCAVVDNTPGACAVM